MPPTSNNLRLTLLGFCAAAFIALPATRGHAAGGKIAIQVVDGHTGEPIAVRMHLKNQHGLLPRINGVPVWHDHFVLDGSHTLRLATGVYTFEMERGLEYKQRTGHFVIQEGARDTKLVQMERFVDMRGEDWWSGDLHIQRPLNDVELLMRADDLHVGSVITWKNGDNRRLRNSPLPQVHRFDGNRVRNLRAGQDQRRGGTLLYFNLPEPLDLPAATREYPPSAAFLKQTRQFPHAHVDIEKPFWWDMPVWIASGMVDSIGIAHDHLWRDGGEDDESDGKPRDRSSYPGPHGNGRWSTDIYYHLLNSGIRIPPSAGSGSGVAPNPVGYNRVYVYIDGEFSYEKWWAALRDGRVVVTNGPLLRPSVQNRPPGHVFRIPAGQTVELEIDLRLATRDKIEYLEIVRDGRVAHAVRLDKWAAAGGRLPALSFDRSGWFLVRAVTANPATFRFASSGPYYVEIGGEPRISRESARFFLDWVYERARQLDLSDPQQKADALGYLRAARNFWEQQLEKANAE